MSRRSDEVKQNVTHRTFGIAFGISVLIAGLTLQEASAYTPQFPLKQGWLGADTAGSIPLDGRHRVLWMFSDTYVRSDTSTNRHGAGMVNNTLAITTWDGYSTNVNYYIRGRDQGAMSSMFPSPGADANGKWWFWVCDGFKYNGKVYIFLDRERNTGGGTMWSFEHFASDMAVMDNVDAEPNPVLWPLTITNLIYSTNFMIGISSYVDAASGYAILWGAKTVNVGGWNYRYFVAFRVAVANLGNPAANLQYYTTGSTWRSAVGSDFSDAQLIMASGSPDFSIRYHPDLGKYVDVQCDDGFPSAKIWARTSSSPYGGWPSAAGATTLVTLANEPNFYTWPAFSYAGKEHLEFYSPVTGRALLTYCQNSGDNGANSVTNVLNNNNLYVPVPRWVQLGPANVNHPPVACAITSPSDGRVFPGPANITVSVSATDPDPNDSIVLVNVFLDGVLAASSGTPPFNCVLHDVGAGDHTIYAEAYDTAEARTNSTSLTVTVAPFTFASYATRLLSCGPVYYWRFNESAGSTIAYEYYNRLDGLYGSRTTNGLAGVVNPPLHGFESTNLAVALNTASPSGGAGYITTPPMNLNTNALTILAWVYPFAPVTNSAGLLFSRSSTCAVGFGYLGGARAPANEIGYTWNHTNTSTWPSRLYTPPGQWSFVAMTVSPSEAVLYCATNGILYASTNSVAHTNEVWDGPTSIGSDTASGSSRVFNGKIDEVAVFNYTLSDSQIISLYTLALAGAPVTLGCQLSGTNLVLSWDHGTLISAPDIDGPWTPVPGASPPGFVVSPGANTFYRVQVYP